METHRPEDATCVITAPAKQPVQPDSGSSSLKHHVQTAADFDANQVPLSMLMLNGTDYTDARTEKVSRQSLTD